jgi:hypothetical protein
MGIDESIVSSILKHERRPNATTFQRSGLPGASQSYLLGPAINVTCQYMTLTVRTGTARQGTAR